MLCLGLCGVFWGGEVGRCLRLFFFGGLRLVLTDVSKDIVVVL